MNLQYDPQKKYLIDIINKDIDVHQMNYELINYFIRYFEQRGVPVEINQVRYLNNPNIIETLNYYLKQELYIQDNHSIIAYNVMSYMIKYKMNFDECLKKIQSARECCQPNMGFVKQLRKFEIELGITQVNRS